MLTVEGGAAAPKAAKAKSPAEGEVQIQIPAEKRKSKRGKNHRRHGSSHVPAIGAAIDNKQDRGAVLEARVLRLRAIASSGCARPSPMSASSFTTITPRRSRSISSRRSRSAARPSSRPPTKAGARVRCRSVKGHPELAAHIAQSVILDEFDLTIVQQDGGRSRPDRAAQSAVRQARTNGRARSFRSRSTS